MWTVDKYSSRTLDLDILLVNDAVIRTASVEIPDSDIKQRWFLAQGILDIDPRITLPAEFQPLRVYLRPLLDRLATYGQAVTEDQDQRRKFGRSSAERESPDGPACLHS
ncbi:hypothetical protein A4G28_18535 [Mycobacterium ostraviense]|uniref:6-hydroxymethyl-7,8-dihydropterin pyrophosphokinase n=1 Tax=Mycobacterium ostraviense TaxID=2738409 RepID=A0A164A2B4_9MYCO|nr:hypothetical protein A4G28_18535 [Mycobacterium ostraviense]